MNRRGFFKSLLSASIVGAIATSARAERVGPINKETMLFMVKRQCRIERRSGIYARIRQAHYAVDGRIYQLYFRLNNVELSTNGDCPCLLCASNDIATAIAGQHHLIALGDMVCARIPIWRD